ncbi:sn-glycerol 3-phosphate transport system permease protein [Bradyrhizobium sp. LB9.1b]
MVECRERLAAAVAGGSAVDRVHPLPDPRDGPAFAVHHTPQWHRGLCRPRQLSGYGGRPDPIFWKALVNNFWFALGTVPTSIALALVMAIWVNRNMRGRGFLRLAYFTPTVLPMIAVANIWLFFYTPDYGLLDQLRGNFGLAGWNWLGDPSTVMGCLIVMVIWKEAGFFMIFYLAALQQLSPDLEEAASIEGASRWYTFRRITFPLLMPTTLFVAINAVINSFKLVDHLVIMTKGGPNNASTLLLYYIYEVAFTFQDSSYAATLTVVLLVLLSAVALIKFGYLDRRIHYQ